MGLMAVMRPERDPDEGEELPSDAQSEGEWEDGPFSQVLEAELLNQ